MHIIKIILISFFCFFSIFKIHSSEDLSTIKKLLEGRYELTSWKQEGITYKYPKVSGTLVVHNDKVSFTLDNNMQMIPLDAAIFGRCYGIGDHSSSHDGMVDMIVKPFIPFILLILLMLSPLVTFLTFLTFLP